VGSGDEIWFIGNKSGLTVLNRPSDPSLKPNEGRSPQAVPLHGIGRDLSPIVTRFFNNAWQEFSTALTTYKEGAEVA
jgi:hypothetical protein